MLLRFNTRIYDRETTDLLTTGARRGRLVSPPGATLTRDFALLSDVTGDRHTSVRREGLQF